jgi:hypothetical protein
VDNELVAKIRNHPAYDETVHSALIEVIEREYSPEQIAVMLHDRALDSLLGGMFTSMRNSPVDEENETAAHEHRLQQAEELMRKGWNFLNKKAQDAQAERKTA